VIDDVQYVHASTLLVLQQFLDNYDYVVVPPNKKIDKSKAIIGLVSDFGMEGLSLNRTFEEMEDFVLQHTRKLWSTDPKLAQLIQYTFPFVSLTNEDLEQLVRYRATKVLTSLERFSKYIEKISIQESAVKWIRHSAKSKFPHENGRGIDKWIDKYLVPQLGVELKKRTRASESSPPPTGFLPSTSLYHAKYNVDIRFKDDKLYYDFETTTPHQEL
jgi:ATP-dependent Clp protease ATP-binding subunit ClpA